MSSNRLRSAALQPIKFLQRLNISRASRFTFRLWLSGLTCSSCVPRHVNLFFVFGPWLSPSPSVDNKIKTLEGIQHPKLVYLNAAHNWIKDASALNNSSLVHLNISANRLSSLATIAVTSLAELIVSENELRVSLFGEAAGEAESRVSVRWPEEDHRVAFVCLIPCFLSR